jgi:hypothetical protein
VKLPITDKFSIPLGELSEDQRSQRKSLLESMLAAVADSVDGSLKPHVIYHALQNGGVISSEDWRAIELQHAERLPGKWLLIYESWQGPSRSYLVCRALYIDEHSVGVVNGTSDPEEEESREVVQIIWVSRDEFRMFGELGRVLL